MIFYFLPPYPPCWDPICFLPALSLFSPNLLSFLPHSAFFPPLRSSSLHCLSHMFTRPPPGGRVLWSSQQLGTTTTICPALGRFLFCPPFFPPLRPSSLHFLSPMFTRPHPGGRVLWSSQQLGAPGLVSLLSSTTRIPPTVVSSSISSARNAASSHHHKTPQKLPAPEDRLVSTTRPTISPPVERADLFELYGSGVARAGGLACHESGAKTSNFGTESLGGLVCRSGTKRKGWIKNGSKWMRWSTSV